MRLFSDNLIAGRRCSGMTLVEILVTSLVASIVLAVVATLTIFGLRSVMAMTNYTELDQQSRNALDILTRDIRQASGLASFSSSKIVLQFPKTTDTCTYTYNQAKGELVRSNSIGSSEVILKECDELTFKIFLRAPSAGFEFNTAGNNYSIAKLIDVSWKCSRQINAQKVNTESIQTAKIVMRN